MHQPLILWHTQEGHYAEVILAMIYEPSGANRVSLQVNSSFKDVQADILGLIL